MTAQNPPYMIQAGSHGAELMRRSISTLLNPAGGVTNPNSCQVTQAVTPAMSVVVGGGAPNANPTGELWIPGNQSANQGLYYGLNDANVTLAIGAANPTNPRIDLVVAQVQDAAYSGSTSAWSLAVVAGTPAASPVAPSAPANSLTLAQVLVGANVTSIVNANITDTRPIVGLNPTTAVAGTPAGRLVLSAGSQAITPSTDVSPTMATDFLRGGMIGGGSLTVPVAGIYLVTGSVDWNGVIGTANQVWTGVYNSSRERVWATVGIGQAGQVVGGTSLLRCVAGDVLTLHTMQASGSSKSIGGGDDGTYLEALLVSI